MLPTELVGANVILPVAKNYVYNGPTVGTLDVLLEQVNTGSNWKGSSNVIYYDLGDLTIQ